MSQKPDEVTAKNSGGDFEPHSEGQVAAVCVDVVDLGEKVEEYQGETKIQAKVALVFASGERQKDKSLALVTSEMTNSASEKGNLRKFLESWRGKSYTPDQVAAGLPLHKLHGQPGLLSIEHVVTKKGNNFAKIRSISPLPKAMPAPEGVAEEYTRPKFLEDKKKSYAEAVAKHRAAHGGDDPGPDLPEPEDEDSSLPF